jgi:ribosomal protein S18 acetylase RimI-like enzyme
MPYEIVFTTDASENSKVVHDGITEHQEKLFGEVAQGGLYFFVHDDGGRTVAGVIGYWSSSGWLYVDALWVDEQLREQGFGTRLMNSIEDAAVERGCRYCYLNTMTYQAPDFYHKLGYEEFARLEDFPPGHSRLFLRKDLRKDS